MNNFGSTHHLGFDESLEDNPFADVVSQNNAFASTSFQRHVPQSSLMTSSDQIIASEWDTGSEHDWSSKDETTQYKTTITQGTTNKHADSALQTVEITDNSAEIYLSAQRTRQEEQEKTVRIEAEAKAILEAEEARKTEARLIKAKEIAEREKAAREAEAREAEAREAEAREAEAREAEAREAEARESKRRVVQSLSKQKLWLV
ncbi:hypothetical protein J3Q64DRAFT_1197870 [Phycomyces blakesleeanus]|uniref:Uncharacterized protein n=1 Tax=Phycomyces blakesleeanus TaxID=4837 RepID=A0ABR3AS08_PHYBL